MYLSYCTCTCDIVFISVHTGSVVGTGYYGIASGPVALSNVFCLGSESSVVDCRFSVLTTGLEHHQDVGVKCIPPPPLCLDGEVRLVDGAYPYWGRVEVCFNEVWGTVTDDFWSYGDGRVVCRQLGYSDSSEYNRVYIIMQ